MREYMEFYKGTAQAIKLTVAGEAIVYEGLNMAFKKIYLEGVHPEFGVVRRSTFTGNLETEYSIWEEKDE